jgi:hypothetical protein
MVVFLALFLALFLACIPVGLVHLPRSQVIMAARRLHRLRRRVRP